MPPTFYLIIVYCRGFWFLKRLWQSSQADLIGAGRLLRLLNFDSLARFMIGYGPQIGRLSLASIDFLEIIFTNRSEGHSFLHVIAYCRSIAFYDLFAEGGLSLSSYSRISCVATCSRDERAHRRVTPECRPRYGIDPTNLGRSSWANEGDQIRGREIMSSSY